MVKLQKNSGDQHLVTIPKELRKAMGWKKGDDLEFEVENSDTLKISKE